MRRFTVCRGVMVAPLMLAVAAFCLAGFVQSVVCLGHDGSVTVEFSFDGTCRPEVPLDDEHVSHTSEYIREPHGDGENCGGCLDVQLDSTALLPADKQTARTIHTAQIETSCCIPGTSFSAAPAFGLVLPVNCRWKYPPPLLKTGDNPVLLL